jgi:hypothetical protein
MGIIGHMNIPSARTRHQAELPQIFRPGCAKIVHFPGGIEEYYDDFEVPATWVMHTKSTPRDDSARLVAGRQ